MIRFLRDRRSSRSRLARLFLATLAFVGTQAAFVRAAFPHVSRAAAMRVMEHPSGAQSQSSVDTPRLPLRGSRRGGPTVGPSAPSAPEATESWQTIPPLGVAATREAPPSFVPPPLFHPPRPR